MPSERKLLYFREGLRVLHRAEHFATFKDTITKMLSIVSPEERHWAVDAIARVLRHKQALEVKKAQKYPQALQELDQKYQDLYNLLKSQVKSVPSSQPSHSQPQSSQSSQPSQPQPQPKSNLKKENPRVSPWSLAKLSPLGGIETSLMIMDWIKSKKKVIIAGTAVASTLGGAFWLYKHFNSEKQKENPEEKESNFDRTVKSIQRYRVFTQLSKDPNFAGDYRDLLNGDPKQLKKKKGVKKKDPVYEKALEWDTEERSLMKEMDQAFKILESRPKLNYELPQLPEPNSVDPKSVIKSKNKESLPNLFSESKVKKTNKSSASKSKKLKSKFVAQESEQKSEQKSKPKTKPRSKSSKNKSLLKLSEDKEKGRLIPIIKRTKRVKKVKT